MMTPKTTAGEEAAARWELRWTPPDDLPADAGILGRTIVAPKGRPACGPFDAPQDAGALSLVLSDRPLRHIARLDQVHGCRVAFVTEAGVTGETDAAVTDRPGLTLTIRTADCVPVLIASPGGVAAAHAGWRGTAEEIARLTLEALAELTGDDPREMAALIGPAIGVCCYAVGPDVAERFPGFTAARGPARHLDLAAVNRAQLVAGGLPPGRILDSSICTRCSQHLFHSHRGSGGKKGRIDAFITFQDDRVRS